MSVDCQLQYMPKKDDGASSKSIRLDEMSLKMYARYVQERAKTASIRKELKELAEEFGVPERTFIRRVEMIQRAFSEMHDLEEKIDAASGKVPEKPQPRGAVSQGVAVKGNRGEKAGAVAVRDDAYGQITMPKNNPLDGLDTAQTSQAAVAVGIVFGGGAAKCLEAFTNTKKPLGERAMLMAQGSNAVANTFLGMYEALRVFGAYGEGNIKEVDEETGEPIGR